MLSEIDKTTIQTISKKYHARRVLLFGSSLDATKESRDIDLAVEGITHGDFFKYYGDLLLALSRPVDVIDLSEKSRFVTLVEREGVPIYG